MTQTPLLQDTAYLDDLRRQMIKFATLQLGNPEQAEDAVQEAMLAALKDASRFTGRSALRTWVFGILKHKIADLLRQRMRLVSVSSLANDDDEDGEALMESLFDAQGHWRDDASPTDWGRPEVHLSQKQFWAVFEACLNHLPPKQARIFMMREFVELDTETICDATGISGNHLFVLLHRCRLRLRACLETRWVNPTESSR